jgi:septal ring factor EnvC (AmiA/AmiB activator)
MHRKQFRQTPIESQKEQLAKQEEALRKEMAELEKVISDAPKLAEERLEQERQERIARASTRRSPLDSPDILEDVRHQSDILIDRPPRPRRAQRRAARLRLVALLGAVIVAGSIVVYLVMQLMNHL